MILSPIFGILLEELLLSIRGSIGGTVFVCQGIFAVIFAVKIAEIIKGWLFILARPETITPLLLKTKADCLSTSMTPIRLIK